MTRLFLLLLGLGLGCERFQPEANRPVEFKKGEKKAHSHEEIKILEEKIYQLEGTAGMIAAFVAGDFADCKTNLPPFEEKLCQVAQTASAEQLIKITGQMAIISESFQTELYGIDCANAVDVGCPVTGSIMDQLANLDPADITQLQTDLAALELEVDGLENRFDDFDGSGNSIETVINNLDQRISDIEALVGGSDYYQWLFLCEDINLWRHEPILRTGDKLTLRFYTAAGNNGMGQLSVGDGDSYIRTNLNPKCNVKFYDLTTEYKVCWNNQDRNASEVSIDTECDNGGASPTVDCTCK